MNTSVDPPDLLLDCVLQTSLDGIVLCRAVRDRNGPIVDFRVVRCNDRAVRMAGVSEEVMLACSMLTVDPDGHRSGIFETYRHVVETGLPIYVEHYFAGGNVWMAQSLARVGDDDVLASWADISPQKRAERANQQQAGLLRSVLDNSLNAIIAFRAVRDEVTGQIVDFRYEAQNEANRRSINRTDEEIIGHTMLEYLPHVMETGLFGRYVRVVETGQPDRFEQEYADDTRSGWFEASVSKWDDGIVLTLVDITGSKDHQQQLEQVRRDLLNANENLRQFAYVASHDLQEPLRKIQSFGDMLQEQFGTQLGEVGRDVIGRMQSATGRMSTLIKDVLAYSRISTHREPFRPIALNQLLAHVCQDLQAAFRETGGQIEVDRLPTVQGDRTQLGHLFTNLLANALKFRADDQPALVWVTCRAVPGTAGPPELNPATVYYEISLTDQGIGFDSKYAEIIFQVFQRLHPRQRYGGTGVGLAICKRIVENHRGAITATGLPGDGATFRVYLPK